MAIGVAERQARDCADMLLELRDHAGRFRPVSGIVHAGRHLVGDQAAVGEREELDADDADIAERGQDLLCGLARGGCRGVGD